MQLQGSRHIPAAPAAVWAALNDPAVLQRCIPGCEKVEAVSDTERSATLAVKLGPVRARFNGRVMLQDVRPGEGCKMVFEGSGGAAGFARGESVVTLTPSEGGTEVGYTVEASIGGKLGQIGGRMIDGAARGMADEFFNTLAGEWAPAEAAVADEAAAPVAATAAANHAATATPAAPAAPRPLPAAPGVQPDAAYIERLRVKWFLLGAGATALGVVLARWLA